MSGALRELLARFDVQVDTKPLSAADAAISGVTKKLHDFGAAITGAAVVAGIRSYVQEMVDVGSAIDDTSQRLGIGAQELQRWQFAANLSGVQTESMNGALTKFQKNVADAADGSSGATDAFKAVGVSVKDGAGQIGQTTDLLRGVATGIAEIQDPAKRTQALMALFGKSGAELAPMFSEGAAGVESLLAELDKAGGGLTDEAIKAMANLGDESDKYDKALLSLKGTMALQILPYISRGVTAMTQLVSAVAQNSEVAGHLKVVMAALGAVGLAAGLKMVAPYAGLAVAIALGVLLIDDLVTAMQGGDSMTGRLLDKLFGKGTGSGKDSVFVQAKDDWNAFYQDVKGKDIGEAISEMFSRVGASLVRFLVDDIPEAVSLATERVEQGVGSTGEKVVAALNKALNPVAWAKNAYKLFSELGERLIDGLVEGFKSGVDKAEKAAGEVIDKIKKKFTISFEVKSPSKWSERLMGHVLSPMATEPAAWTPRVVGELDKFVRGIQAPLAGMAADTGWADQAGAAARGAASLATQARGVALTQHNTITLDARGRDTSEVRRIHRDALDDTGAAALEALEALA